MRKLILQMQLSLDGFVGRKDGGLDWMTKETGSNQIKYLQRLTNNMDTILLGRKMASESIPHWEKVAKTKSAGEEFEYAKTFADTRKIIFSKTLKKTEGKNTTVESRDLVESVTQLKKEPGKNIIVYGGAKFVSELIKHHLVDEYYLLSNPTAIGTGLEIFTDEVNLKLIDSVSFKNGVVANQYAPRNPS